MSIIRAVGVVLGCVFCTTTTVLSGSGNRGACEKDEISPDVRIAACTSVMNEKQRSKLDRAIAHNNRGNAWSGKGEYDKAIADYTEAISLDPRYAIAYHNRGNAWADKGERDKAIDDFSEAIRLDPNYTRAYYNRGVTWGDKGEHDKAIADYTKAISLNPSDASAYYNRADAWGAKGEHDKAIADYTEAISLGPNDARARDYNFRGNAWRAKGEHDKAIADYSQAITLDPTIAQFYNNRGIAWFAMGAFDKAIADYSTAISLDPDSASAFVFRAGVWNAKGERDKAIADIAMAGKLDSRFALRNEMTIGRPTFDCAKTRWPELGAIICAGTDAQAADWDMAGAYWALYFSKFGQDRTAFRDRHVKWLDQLGARCPRLPTKASASDCVAQAYSDRAGAYRGELQGDALAESQSLPEQRLQIQETLARLGHLEGQTDGVFGASTRNAIMGFQRSRGESATGFLTINQKGALGVFDSQQAQNEYEAENDVPSIENGIQPSDDNVEAFSNSSGDPSVRDAEALSQGAACRIPDAGAFPDELTDAAADATRNSQFPTPTANRLKELFTNSLRELAERASFDRRSGKSGGATPDAVPYYPVQLNATLAMERALPAELAACLPAFRQLLAEFEATRMFTMGISWHYSESRMQLAKPIGQNGKIAGVFGLQCQREPDPNNITAPVPALHAGLLIPGIDLVESPTAGSLATADLSYRVQARIEPEGANLSTADADALTQVLTAPQVTLWDQNGDRMIQLDAVPSVDALYSAKMPSTRNMGEDDALKGFIASCLGNPNLSELEENNASSSYGENTTFQACRPKGNMENVSSAFGAFILHQKMAELCDANFGGYTDLFDEFGRMAADAEMVLRNLGPDGVAKLNAARDSMKQAEAMLRLTFSGQGQRQYRDCQGLRTQIELVKIAVCQ